MCLCIVIRTILFELPIITLVSVQMMTPEQLHNHKGGFHP